MPQIKPGTRLRSAVCATEVMVVAAPKDADVDLQCGGSDMLDVGGGTQLGKRYVNEAGTLEVLCTKPGEGSLAADGAVLTIKGAKPLPASD